MRLPTALTIASLLLVASTPSALATGHHHDHASPEPHVLVLHEVRVGDDTYYVVDDHGALQLWKETNGLDHGGQYALLGGAQTGLQVETVCVHDGEVEYSAVDGACEEGEAVAPDTRVTNGHLVRQIQGLLP